MTLRPDLLAGRRFAVSGLPGELGDAVRGLGAELPEVPEPLAAARSGSHDPGTDEAGLAAWCTAERPLHGIVVAVPPADACAGPSATADPDPTADPTAITGPLSAVWRAVRAVAVEALIPPGSGGRIVLIGPLRAEAAGTAPVTAGLENLARTLSVEWARFGLTAVCLDPGPASTLAELAALTGFVLSPGGGYLSGCCLRLGSVSVAPRPLI